MVLDKDSLFQLLRPAPFMPRQKDDPEALLQEFEKYVETIKLLLVATATPGTHTPDHVSCALCWKEKQTLISVGGEEMVKLFTQVGKVTGDEVFGTALAKIRHGITIGGREMARLEKLEVTGEYQHGSAGQQAIAVQAEVQMISLKCDRCDYVTKPCRKQPRIL